MRTMTTVSRMILVSIAGATVVSIATGVLRAQQPTPAPAAATSANRTPAVAGRALKVDIVLDRFKGASKISSFPYTLFLSEPSPTGNPVNASLRMDTTVPTGRNTTTSADHVTTTSTSWQNVGTDIDVTARSTTDDGRYPLSLTIQDSSIYSPDGTPKTTDPTAFRQLRISTTVMVRDGQPLQFSVGTDPLTGETVKATVTATAIK